MPAVEAGVEPSLAAELELAAVPHEELVRRLYRLCLRREREPDALQHAVTKLTNGTLSRASLIRDVVTSGEFESVRLLCLSRYRGEPHLLDVGDASGGGAHRPRSRT